MSKCSRSQNIFWGIVICLLSSIFAYFFLQEAFLRTKRAFLYSKLVKEGNIIEGTVLDKRQTHPSSRSRKTVYYYLGYSYNYNGKEYVEEDFPAPSEIYYSLSNGQNILIYVSRDAPRHSIPTFYTPHHLTTLSYAVIGLMSAAATLFAWYLLYLYAKGRLTNEIIEKKLAKWNRKIF